MAPHLTLAELDTVTKMAAKGRLPREVRTVIERGRKRKSIDTPTVDNIRLAMQGKTHRRGTVETRGRKPILTPKKVRSLEKARKDLQKQAKGKEVPMNRIVRRARIKVDESTARKALAKVRGVKWRPCREKPQRSPEQCAVREEWCAKKRYLPEKYFRNTADMIIDCKKYELPLTIGARQRAVSKRARGAYRKRSEGLKKELTKPNDKRHRTNPGGMAWVLAGIVGDKIRMWEYIPGKWNGEVAADMYRKPMRKVLAKHRATKKVWRVVEDNDPAGFKSSKARAAKKEVGIKEVSLPPYSPDLNPLDFSLWKTVEIRAREGFGKKTVTVKEYKAKLRQTALRLSAKIVGKAVQKMKERIALVFEAKGGNIPRD